LPSNARIVCSPGGYLQYQGIDVSHARAIIPRIQTVLESFRKAGFPIYHTREGHRPDLSTLSIRELKRSRDNPSGKGIGDRGPEGRFLVRGEPGHAIVAELAPLDNEPVIDKPGRSAFQYTDFKLLLDLKGVRNLVLCGVTTDVCVMSTMRDANDMGLDCLLLIDATAAGSKKLHEAAIDMVCMEGGIFGAVASAQEVLAVLESK
jgi:nicotinamidase-related amidase